MVVRVMRLASSCHEHGYQKRKKKKLFGDRRDRLVAAAEAAKAAAERRSPGQAERLHRSIA